MVAMIGAVSIHGFSVYIIASRPLREFVPPKEQTQIEIDLRPAMPLIEPEPIKPPQVPPKEDVVRNNDPKKDKAQKNLPRRPKQKTPPVLPSKDPVLKPEPSVQQPPSRIKTIDESSTMVPQADRPTLDMDLLRTPSSATSDSLLDRLMNQNGQGLLATDWDTLDKSLDRPSDAPVSDAKRAARTAQRFLQEDLVQDGISAGMANDYFRLLQERIDAVWDPNPRHLNDAGDSVGRITMMRDSLERRAAWGEVFKVYLELAEEYARGEKPTLEPKRRSQLREMFRSRKGNFRVHAIGEILLTQNNKGEILTLQVKTSSGHPQIDAGMIETIQKALILMPPPPQRLSLGRSFSSLWRLRVTWRMVPPTALLTGASFDLSPKGVDMDMPFEMKRRKKIMLLTYDNRSGRRESQR
jgi:outer membrane biosynthesis protein TonB